MIVKVEDQVPFMEGLDSRTSLSQPGENDAHVGDQAHLQALGQAHFQTKLLSKVDLNQDCFGHLFKDYYCLWTCFKVQTQGGVKRPKLKIVRA